MTAVLLAVAGGVVAVAVGYRRQLWRRLTRRVGGPRHTTAWVPVAGGEGGGRPDLHLAVAGDVGHPSHRLDAVGAALAGIDRAQPFDGLVLLGDNAYPSGDPARLASTVSRPFRTVLGHAGLYAILGNHDVRRGHAAGQMAALRMPGRWWSRHLAGDTLLVGLDSTRVGDPDQHAWLEQTLATATERWRVVAVHHPPYSAGYQGSSLAVRRRWAPLFARHGVHLVLSGHDHDYQRSVPVDGVTYVVTGGAARPRHTGRAAFTAVSLGWLHAVELAMAGNRLVVRAVGADGRVGDEATLDVVTTGPRTGGPRTAL
jgi:hypothetical protein